MKQVVAFFEGEQARIRSAGYDEDQYSEESTYLRDNALDHLFTVASLIKSVGFSGEYEARVVVTPLFRSTYERFRPGDVGIVSYVELGTAQTVDDRFSRRAYREGGEVAPLPIHSVTAGPLLRPESLATVKALMQSAGISDPEVRMSQVPLR